MKSYDLIMINPPSGTKKGGERVIRNYFMVSASNKNFNFLQHIYRSLKVDGKAGAAVVIPDISSEVRGLFIPVIIEKLTDNVYISP